MSKSTPHTFLPRRLRSGLLLALLLLLMPTPARSDDVPANDWGEFFSYYQRFLHERLPRGVRKTGDEAADRAAKLENHRELAVLTGKLSEVCNAFAHSGMFPALADPDIKKEDKNKIPGTWNFYRNVPPNAADIWQESCYLRYLSLLHESEVDIDRLAQLRDYADQLAEFEPLQKLHIHAKRVWYAKTLDRVERTSGKASDSGLQASGSASNTNPEARSLKPEALLTEAIRDFRPFLMRHLTVAHIDLAERFVIASGLYPSDEISKLLHLMVDEANEIKAGMERKRNDGIPDELLERIELLQGLLRQQELIGKAMPVWGTDLAGNVFDDRTLEGKIVLLDFWATWCTPCVAEFPHLKRLYEKYHDRGFEIIGYNVDNDLELLLEFLERRPLPWPVLVREKGLEQDKLPISTYYGARKLPVVILRDRDGKVISIDARGSALDEILERLFE